MAEIKILNSYGEYSDVVKMHRAFAKMAERGLSVGIDTILNNPNEFPQFKGYSRESLTRVKDNMNSLNPEGKIPTKEQIKASRLEFDKVHTRNLSAVNNRLNLPSTTESRQRNADCKALIRGARWKKVLAGLGRALVTAGLVTGSVLFGMFLGGPLGIGLAIGLGVAGGLHHLITAFPFARAVKSLNAIIKENKAVVNGDANVLGSDRSCARELANEVQMLRERDRYMSDEQSRVNSDTYLGVEEDKNNLYTDDMIQKYVENGNELSSLPFDEERLKTVPIECWKKRIESGKAPFIEIFNGKNEAGEETFRRIGIPEEMLSAIPTETWIKYAKHKGILDAIPDAVRNREEFKKAVPTEEKTIVPTAEAHNEEARGEATKGTSAEKTVTEEAHVEETPVEEAHDEENDLEHSAEDMPISVDEKNPDVINFYVNDGGDLTKLSEEQLKLVTPVTWGNIASTVKDLSTLPPVIKNNEEFKKAYEEKHPEVKLTAATPETPAEEEKKDGEFDKLKKMYERFNDAGNTFTRDQLSQEITTTIQYLRKNMKLYRNQVAMLDFFRKGNLAIRMFNSENLDGELTKINESDLAEVASEALELRTLLVGIKEFGEGKVDRTKLAEYAKQIGTDGVLDDMIKLIDNDQNGKEGEFDNILHDYYKFEEQKLDGTLSVDSAQNEIKKTILYIKENVKIIENQNKLYDYYGDEELLKKLFETKNIDEELVKITDKDQLALLAENSLTLRAILVGLQEKQLGILDQRSIIEFANEQADVNQETLGEIEEMLVADKNGKIFSERNEEGSVEEEENKGSVAHVSQEEINEVKKEHPEDFEELEKVIEKTSNEDESEAEAEEEDAPAEAEASVEEDQPEQQETGAERKRREQREMGQALKSRGFMVKNGRVVPAPKGKGSKPKKGTPSATIEHE